MKLLPEIIQTLNERNVDNRRDVRRDIDKVYDRAVDHLLLLSSAGYSQPTGQMTVSGIGPSS